MPQCLLEVLCTQNAAACYSLATVSSWLQTMKWMSVDTPGSRELWQVRSESSEPLLPERDVKQDGSGCVLDWARARAMKWLRAWSHPGSTFSTAYLSFPWSRRAHCRAQASSDGNSERAFWKRGDRGACEKVKSHSGHESKGLHPESASSVEISYERTEP